MNQPDPNLVYQPDKAVVTAYYDEEGYCHTVEVRLNAPGLSREDVAEAVRAVFSPGPSGEPQVPFRHNELGGTAVIQMNGHPLLKHATGVNQATRKN